MQTMVGHLLSAFSSTAVNMVYVVPACLCRRKLAQFQGPALLVYNDASFEADDCKGIQKLQQSIKVKDPFKVGKFGIGFNSI